MIFDSCLLPIFAESLDNTMVENNGKGQFLQDNGRYHSEGFTMEFPFDILDSIFHFLRSHPQSLVACSEAHPVFSQAVERHLYYHIKFCSNWDSWAEYTAVGYTLEPSDLVKLLSNTPHIINHVRVLEIDRLERMPRATRRSLEKLLSMLSKSKLECIILLAPSHTIWWKGLSQSLKSAVENCLRLPTLQRVHVGQLDFPLSILDKHTNVNCFSLSGSPQIPDSSDNTSPQLTALSFDRIHPSHLPFFITWAKQHVVNLQSLKCDYSNEKVISELLEVCSDTLNSLDFQLKSPVEPDFLVHHIPTQSINLSSLPHLQRLTIRGTVVPYGYYTEDYKSHIPAVVEIFKTAPPLQQLTIYIRVNDGVIQFFPAVNFPFFTALAESAASFRHIDLYIRGITTEMVVPLLGEYGEVAALIEQGVLVIHMGESAPEDSRFGW